MAFPQHNSRKRKLQNVNDLLRHTASITWASSWFLFINACAYFVQASQLRGSKETIMASNVEQLQKIFVGGLSKDGDENALTDAFSSYGSIQEVSVLRDSSGKSRGFGFVLFDEATSVDDLMKEKKEGKVFYVSGSPVEVKRALPKVDRADLLRDRTSAARHMSSVGVKKVFVGGLANTTVAVDLEAYFSQFGRGFNLRL